MGTENSCTSQTEIARLVSLARRHGMADTYQGKRKWIRYSLGMVLEVTTNPADPGAAWPAIMHNISGGGFGFWSKRRLRALTGIYVREHAEGSQAEWIPAKVNGCTVGIRGYLIGAAFEHPLSPEVPSDPAGGGSQTTPGKAVGGPPAAGAKPPRAAWMSLRTKCGLASAVACSIAIAAASMIGAFSPAETWPLRLLWVGMACTWAFGLGWLAGAILVSADARFISGFHQAARRLASGVPDPLAGSAAPSKELEDLRGTLQDLQAAWRRREDSERHQRQKLQELNQIKSNLLSIVSHDLRTPMTSILLYARMLTEELDTLPRKDQLHFLNIISEECTRLSRLVDDLLEVQRLESGRARWDLKPLDVSEAMRACAEVFKALAESKSIRFTMDCPESLPLVEADPDRISQLLSNLLSNAIKYTPCGGKVHLSAAASSTEIVICVADTGPGIPREKWDQIFDRFSQLSNPDTSEIAGVGLGLYIVRQIVEMLRGAVWLDSEEGRGSEFFVSLPPKESSGRSDAEQKKPTSRGRVLVCDADPQIAAMISQALRSDDFEVHVAHSGCRLLAHLAQGETEVVVTDVLLPDMNSSGLLEAINKITPRSFRLVIHSYAGDELDLRRRGVDIVLRRPATKEELRQAVHLAMQGRGAGELGVLLVSSPTLDAEQLKRHLAEAGHTPIVAETLPEAMELAHNHAIDSMVLSADLLGHRWEKLKHLKSPAGRPVRVLVLCPNLRRKEHRLAETHGVTALTYGPGNEAQVLEAIQPAPEAPVPEYSP